MNWDKIKNWVFGGAGAAALLILYQFMQWQVSVEVAKQLAAQDIGTDSKIVSMDDEIDANGAAAAANTTRIDGNERRVEQAFAVLLGRDPE